MARGATQAARARRALRRRRRTRTPRRQREEFGGLNWGSAFFGWLVAVGVATLLTAILSAAGAAIGLTSASSSDATSNAGTIGIVGGILLLLVLMVAYYAGGYVAGRMSPLRRAPAGARRVAHRADRHGRPRGRGAVLGAKYNVLSQLKLPRIPVDEGSLTTGGLIALVAIVARDRCSRPSPAASRAPTSTARSTEPES